MTVLFMDSANGGEVATKWTVGNPGTTLTAASPTGRSIYRNQNNGAHQYYQDIPATASVLVGWKMLVSTLTDDASTNAQLIEFRGDSGATVHVVMCIDGTGVVKARLASGNGTVLASSAAGVILAETFHHYEMRVTVADSGGRVEIWVDGTQHVNFTGDTKNAGTNTTIDRIRFGRSIGQSECCDFSISDSTTNLGVTQVADMLPTGNGNSSGLVGSDGNSTDNYLLADEAAPNGDTDYNIGDTEGEKDTYAMANLPTGTWDVLAVQANINARKADAGTRFMRPVIRVNGTDYNGASVSMSESYDTYWEVWNTNPDTAAAWTESEVDAIEVGAEARDS